MLFSPRQSMLRRMLNRMHALLDRGGDGAQDGANRRYLDGMSAARLERDLGLIRGEDGRYRPY